MNISYLDNLEIPNPNIFLLSLLPKLLFLGMPATGIFCRGNASKIKLGAAGAAPARLCD